ncbi:hypothetical protein BHE74_00050332, partial [Ensete ventricosum]
DGSRHRRRRSGEHMGRATRWIRGLLGGKKANPGEPSAGIKEKRKWSFGKSSREKERQLSPLRRGEHPRPPSPAPSEERKGSYRELTRLCGTAALVVDEEEQSKRAIAVAAATAAVAEAAVAAAQAAAVVVRLTSSGRTVVGLVGGKREESAAVKIQSTFRGYLVGLLCSSPFSTGTLLTFYFPLLSLDLLPFPFRFGGLIDTVVEEEYLLARRALRALRGLVKLQALVRGNIVRKQAAETLRCMQALVRVQARARACRALRSERDGSEKGNRMRAVSFRSHFSDLCSCNFVLFIICMYKSYRVQGPPTPEKYEQAVRSSATKSDGTCALKRNSSKHAGADDRPDTAAWNWLDRWVEERYWDSREGARKTGIFALIDDEKNAKILEVDPGKPQFSHKRSNHHQYSCSTLTSDYNSRSFTTVQDSPSKDSTAAQQSIPSPSSVNMQQQCLSSLRFPLEVVGFCESPQFYSSSSRRGSTTKGPFTPSNGEGSQSLFSGFADFPSYMANTQSSRAKLRSHSAPKQRPEYDKSGSLKRSSGAVVAQRSSSLHAKFTNKAYPGSGRLDRLGMPLRI